MRRPRLLRCQAETFACAAMCRMRAIEGASEMKRDRVGAPPNVYIAVR